MLEHCAYEEVLKTTEDYTKRSRADLHWGTVEHNIWKTGILPPKEFFGPVTKSQLKSLELENQEMKLTICTLNADLIETKKILYDN